MSKEESEEEEQIEEEIEEIEPEEKEALEKVMEQVGFKGMTSKEFMKKLEELEKSKGIMDGRFDIQALKIIKEKKEKFEEMTCEELGIMRAYYDFLRQELKVISEDTIKVWGEYKNNLQNIDELIKQKQCEMKKL